MSRAQTHSFSVVDVHIVIRSGDRVLLGLRKNTGYMDVTVQGVVGVV